MGDRDDNEGGSEPKGAKAQKTAGDHRREREAAALRANLMRRKQQMRARRSGEEDQRDGSLRTSGEDSGQANPPADGKPQADSE